MKRPLVTDELWSIIEPLLPAQRPKPKGGRPRMADRAVLTGILFVLRSGIPWEMMPQEMGCGSGVTCWRRLRDWQEAGLWDALHHELLQQLHWAGRIDWSRACMDSASIPAKRGAQPQAQIRRTEARQERNATWLTDRNGLPLAFVLTGANVHDSVPLAQLLDAVAPLKGRRGRPRKRPDKLHADKAYDHRRCRRACCQRGIEPRIARRGVESSERLGRHRWVVERTLAWFGRMRRLSIRYERRQSIHHAFTALACSLICFNALLERF